MSEIILCKECSKEVDLRKIPFFCKECEQFRTQITDRQKVREAVEKLLDLECSNLNKLAKHCGECQSCARKKYIFAEWLEDEK